MEAASPSPVLFPAFCWVPTETLQPGRSHTAGICTPRARGGASALVVHLLQVGVRKAVVARFAEAQLLRPPAFPLDVLLNGRVPPLPLALLRVVHRGVDGGGSEEAAEEHLLVAQPPPPDPRLTGLLPAEQTGV
ncbi:uncharacterized protein Tco025E_08817 [Trypanosoma conorhini]|uniref:Uncharacterized protein n=1 Tax=Trypanosoma conorhini TaxID=83891 RepID=A0A422N4I5_9TRYP|nr:uncharacterized protein Tco025E_08817 [Trypanosoma conorhini]RNF00388.1 hypothetical protein Tco025E_08817 [Trypanosoma conorhini]